MWLEVCRRLMLELKYAVEVPFVLSAVAGVSILLFEELLAHALNTERENFSIPFCPACKTAFAQLPDVVSGNPVVEWIEPAVEPRLCREYGLVEPFLGTLLVSISG